MPGKNYPLKLSILGIAAVAGGYAASLFTSLPLYVVFAQAAFFYAFSFLLNARLNKAIQSENPNQFTYSFLGLTGLKIMGSIMLLLCMFYFSRASQRFPEALYTMACYFIFTIFEVIIWMNKLKGK